MHLFAGSSHPALAKALSAELKAPLGSLVTKTFSSGERYVRFGESVRGRDVYILQTAGKHPNEDMMELFLLCQAAKLSFAKTVHVLLPHMPYARQDRVSEPREPISAKLIADLLEKAGADHVLVLELHSDQIQGFFSVPADALSSRLIFAKEFRKKKLKNPVVVAPDVGGAKRAKKFADALGVPLAILHKSRPEHHEAEVLEVVGDVEGKTCILYDDIIDTAGTLLSGKEALLARGANKDVYAAATHGVFSGPANDRLKKAGFAEVVVTDSIPQDDNAFPGLTVLPIAPLLAEVIRHIESGQSVSELYGE
ncbi:MAG: ribose-phosphate pyrophosphokinase [Candidatus Peribacteraceae bacterium]|nr:ribose-phosphate pyrophosphokinase [Candidatus Peribacteraceae bacterium]